MLTKIIDNARIEAIKALIQQANNIVITCHISPDGDAIGSTLGLYWYLKEIGKESHIIVPNMYPNFLEWIDGSNNILVYETQTEEAKQLIVDSDLIFCLDYNDLARVNRVQDAITESKAKRILIDHHLNPNIECEVQISHPEASATCELIYRIIDALGDTEQITKSCAEALYAGLMTDTGNFSYNSQNPDLYIIVSELLKKGINKDEIYNKVYNVYSEHRLRMIGYCLHKKMRIYPEQRTAVIALSKEECERFHYIKGDTEGLVNMPLQIKEIDVSVFLRQDDNKIKISFRSQGEVHVNKMAEEFKGGGHKNAAGGESYHSLPVTLRRVESVIKRRAEFDFNNKPQHNTTNQAN
ncbi:MAG: bifunctional oligoribonuclease/PAP phosphatase NrnA [Bacteroidales bacterium]|nr:bifunctional oligoribonuclease/PAP phosphatase NrnA [Bacteroidales bacterium]